MYYIGIDLAWSSNNYSGIAILKDNKLIYNDILKDINEIAKLIKQYPNAKVGIDAPLQIKNIDGNRAIEIEFLKDYSSKKLGVYPVNRKLLSDSNGKVVGEELAKLIPQKLGVDLFEVYPHATILECFHGSVLPYKRKKGRGVDFIRSQLNMLQDYLHENLIIEKKENIEIYKGQSLKHLEDKLDAIVCAYTLLYTHTNPFKLYKNILLIPKNNN